MKGMISTGLLGLLSSSSGTPPWPSVAVSNGHRRGSVVLCGLLLLSSGSPSWPRAPVSRCRSALVSDGHQRGLVRLCGLLLLSECAVAVSQ